jgi:plasmid stabilization system protein ParE
MILFSSEALSDIDRVRTFLEVRNPDAAVRALRAIWMALERVEMLWGKAARRRHPSAD